MAANRIQGGLPFNNAGATAFTGGAKELGGSYASAYNAALDMNKQNYNNVLSGFQDTATALDADQNKVAQGFAGLDNRVMSGIDSIGGARRNEIADQYAAATGNATQSLISRGLGNTGVVESVGRGLEYDRQKSETQLADNLAGMRAQYQTQIGTNNLNYLGQAINDRSGLAQNQLGWMNSVNSPYPDAGMYAGLANQYGAMQGGGSGAYIPGGGSVTKGGTQFAPQTGSASAGYTPPLAGSGGYVHDPNYGQGVDAIRQSLGMKPMPGSAYQPQSKSSFGSESAGETRGGGAQQSFADAYGGAFGGSVGAMGSTDTPGKDSSSFDQAAYEDAYGYLKELY